VELLEPFLRGDERALARAITLVESGRSAGQELLQALRPRTGKARIVGLTGSPGSGKSTLADKLIGAIREQGRRVAVAAVDPTSPYSGGAILGDRIRMTRHHRDAGVYIRSMATRGHLGGLAAATLQVVALLDAYGFDDILVETVGVGQSEVDIVQLADSTVLVLTPGYGDGVQAFKAGIMEVADIFVVNKFDLPGGLRLKREVRAALSLGVWPQGSWKPPVLEATATEGTGLEQLYEKLDAHYAYLQDSGRLEDIRRRRARFEISALLTEQVRRGLEQRDEAFAEAVLSGKMTPEEAVREMLGVKSEKGSVAP
jgi:LAO/AO transport system kinase